MPKKSTKTKTEEVKENIENKEKKESTKEIFIEHNVELEELKKKSKEYFELAQRTMADFDNFKKRVIKEKEMLYADAVCTVVTKILPTIDSLERALQHADTKKEESIVDGVKMVLKQFKDSLLSIGVEEINAVGEKFDPELHHAVMHIEDDNFGDNEVAEELQRGYIINERVIRHSMVKVAN